MLWSFYRSFPAIVFAACFVSNAFEFHDDGVYVFQLYGINPKDLCGERMSAFVVIELLCEFKSTILHKLNKLLSAAYVIKICPMIYPPSFGKWIALGLKALNYSAVHDPLPTLCIGQRNSK